jgi:hypothetical protein
MTTGMLEIVLFTDDTWFQFYQADFRHLLWRRVGERFANVNVVNRVPHGGRGVMVWAGISYRERTQWNFINGNLNDEILRPTVVPLICHHHLMFQHDEARHLVARICTQILEAENVPLIPWQHTHLTSLIGLLWIDMYDSMFQFPQNIQPFFTAIEEEWDNIPQATINSLINFIQRRCVALHEENGGHTRY